MAHLGYEGDEAAQGDCHLHAFSCHQLLIMHPRHTAATSHKPSRPQLHVQNSWIQAIPLREKGIVGHTTIASARQDWQSCHCQGLPDQRLEA